MSWLDSMPTRWELRSPKALFSERRAHNLPEDVHLTPSQKFGVLPQSEYIEITGGSVVLNVAGQNAMKHVEPDDFIIHLRSFQGGLELARQSGKVSTAYTVIEPKSTAVPGFFRWLLKSSAFIQEIQTTTNQLRDGQSIRWTDFVTVPLPTPPFHEQRAIAEYLDRETQKIDELITEQRGLIETLRERRQAVISSAVLGVPQPRLDMDRPSVGPQWSWLSLLRPMLDRVDYRGATPPKTAEGVQLITARNVRAGWIDYAENREYIDSANYDHVMRRGVPAVGDLLFTMEAPLGNVAVVDDPHIALAQRIVKFRVDPELATPRFLMYEMMGQQFQAQLQRRASGSTALGIKASKLSSLSLALPSLAKQREIVEYLDGQTSRSDELISESEDLIALSQERRAALITAAVTGQIDVRAAA